MKPALPLAAWLTPDRHADVARVNGVLIPLAQLRSDVARLCSTLQQRSQQRWALCFEQSYPFLVALLATLHAGKQPVLHGHLRPQLLQEQRDSYDALLSDIPLAVDVPGLQLPLSAGERPAQPLPPLPAGAALTLYTSGSTGAPRAVIKPVAALDEEIRWLQRAWGARLDGLTVAGTVSHQHLYGLTFRIMLPMALGLCFENTQLLYSEQLSALSADCRYLLVSSPASLRRLDTRLSAPACGLIVSAGGALTAADAQQVQGWLGCAVDEIYGSTETGIIATRQNGGEEPLWQPFDGVTLSAEAEGRWRVQSPLIAEPQGLQLDDRLAFTGSGFALCGRHDRIAKIEDKRVSLSEVERRLLALPQVREAAVLVLRREGRNVLGALLVLETPPQTSAQRVALTRQWRQALRPWLEPVAVPRYWRLAAAIPCNSQSKRDWQQIEELFNAS